MTNQIKLLSKRGHEIADNNLVGYITIGVDTTDIQTHSLGGLDEPVDENGHDI